MKAQYTIGLDYGTNSVRALIVNVANGAEVAAAVWTYAHGTQGVILSRDPNLARQHPAITSTARKSPSSRRSPRRRNPSKVSSPTRSSASAWTRPAARRCPWTRTASRCVQKKIREQSRRDGVAVERPHRRRRSGRDHRAGEKNPPAISRQVRRHLFERMVLQQDSACLRTAPEVFNAAHSWIELSDFVPAALTGTLAPDKFIAGVCAAGHKAMWNANGAAIPTRNFCPSSIRSSAQLRDA
jgi:L-ribulokinase